MTLPDDIKTFVQQNFAQNEQLEIMRILETAKIHDGSAANHRLLRCALIASGLTLNGLLRQIEILKIDWRDVIMGGEYEERNQQLVQVRDLSKPFLPSHGGSGDQPVSTKSTPGLMNEKDIKRVKELVKMGETQYRGPDKECSICHKMFKGYGHRAQPINDGICCTDCNYDIVYPARTAQEER